MKFSLLLLKTMEKISKKRLFSEVAENIENGVKIAKKEYVFENYGTLLKGIYPNN